MGKIYKGYELLQAIAQGELQAGAKFYDTKTGREYILTENGKAYENRQYYEDEPESQLQEEYTIRELAQAEFKLIENEINIKNIEELYVSDRQIGVGVLENWTGRKLDLVLANKINELTQEVNKLNEERKNNYELNPKARKTIK